MLFFKRGDEMWGVLRLGVLGWMCGWYVLAHAWPGMVTHVSDGDTVWVQALQGGQVFKLRLQGLDAPEICQAWGPQSRDALHAVLHDQMVDVQGQYHDSYGRLLAQLSRQGHDVGSWMVAHGHAWSYSYRGRPGVYDAAQAAAQSQQLGLFADARAIQPRWFRKQFGSCHAPAQSGVQ
ncbi:MAG: thermonuclease family protein [Limnohabitans sp.]|nr:thermonuclease family protein [Limnohabitans sp.]